MQKAAQHFCRGARRSLPFLAKRRARLVPGETANASVAREQLLGGPLCQITLEAAGRSAFAAIRLDAGALQLIVDGSLGGAAPDPDDEQELVPMAQLTLAQRALVVRVGRALAMDFAESLREITGTDLTVVRAECTRAEDAADAPKESIATECLFDGVQGRASIWLLAGTDLLEAPTRALGTGSGVPVDPRLAEALHGVPLDVVAELGRVKLGLRRLLSLRAGEVLRLSLATDDPIQVRVGGIPKFFGVPVISRGQLSVQITSRHGE